MLILGLPTLRTFTRVVKSEFKDCREIYFLPDSREPTLSGLAAVNHSDWHRVRKKQKDTDAQTGGEV